MNPKILLVEDSSSLAVLYKQYLKNEPYDVVHVEKGQEAMRFLQRTLPSIVILDLQLPDMQGDEILQWMDEHDINVPVIIATAHGSVDLAVKLIHLGAKDFLEKPIRADRLKTSIEIHLKQAKLETMLEDMQQKMERSRYHGFIGSSAPMQATYKMIESVAPTTASVFIIGESGTGKEVCANAIHDESDRSNKEFVAINCGAIPKDLMESEIFGHTKGAFTGATSDRKGAATQAHGGTLFLDELCEMDLEMQKKLLRFLQTGTFTPLGANKEVKVDVRIICATNRDPLKEVREGRFREDLYYRVHVVPIHLAPLRERGKDIVALAQHFLKLYAKQDKKIFQTISKDAQRLLSSYAWPGNVRQLQNILRNIVVLNNEKILSSELLPMEVKQISHTQTSSHQRAQTPPPALHVNIETTEQSPAKAPADIPAAGAPTPFEPASPRSKPVTIRPMWMVERETIQEAIEYCDGNVLNAAVLLELSPSTVYRKKQAWESNDEFSQTE